MLVEDVHAVAGDLGQARLDRLDVALVLEQHVERHDDGAGLEDAEVDDREPRQVRTAQGNAIAALDAIGDEQMGDLVGRRVDRRIAEPGAADDDGIAIRKSACTALEN